MKIEVKLLLFLVFIPSLFCFGQKRFVTFETTTKTTKICQGKTIGVIATLVPPFEESKSFMWAGDSENFREAKNELAIVNSSKTGEKRLKFTLVLGENKKLDTVFVVTVLPNPEVTVTFSKGNLSLENKNNENIVSYKWKYNGALLPDVPDSIIKHPKQGKYQVFVIDRNGCRGTSQVINVE